MLSRPVRVGWPFQARLLFFLANYLLRICRCQEKKIWPRQKKTTQTKQTNKQTHRSKAEFVSKPWWKSWKVNTRQRVNTHRGLCSARSLSLEAWTGPLSDLNLQPVCWHVDNTCSYAWLRHIRLWNSTSSTGPLTICHFLQIFSIMALFVRHATGRVRE